MRRVTIKSIVLENFRGAKERVVSFDPKETTISGGNGTGKTTIREAFLWCLFGKDSEGRTDYDIKRREGNTPLQMVDASVEVVLEVDGQTTKLKRVLHEKWQKPTGETDLVFRGNETQCFYNDVPCKVSEYAQKVDDIIPTGAFQLLTNPAHFLNLDWKKQREILFQMAGVASDEELARGNREFEELLELITNKTLDEYRRELSARKRKCKEQLDQIQPKIDQTEKLKPEVEDWKAIEARRDEICDKLDKLQDAKADESKALAVHLEECRNIEIKIDSLKSKANLIRNGIKSEYNTAVANLQDNIKAKERELANLKNSHRDNISSIERKIDDKMQRKASIEVAINAARREWEQKNSEEYSGENTCPHCHQQLPEEQIAKAKEIFNSAKIRSLDEIAQKGKSLADDLKEIDKIIDTLKIDLAEEQREANSNQSAIDKVEAELKALMSTEVARPIDSDEAIVLDKQVAELQEKLGELRANGSTPASTEIDEEIRSLQNERQKLTNRLLDAVTIERYNGEIERLNEQGKKLAQEIADIEKLEKVATDFTKAKITDTESRINELFTMVQFQLFDYTQEGKEVEVCVPIVSNATYPVANKASQVNAGIDCINTMARHFGVTAPIFIDNSESVNNYIDTESQMIYLRVTQDKELVIK